MASRAYSVSVASGAVPVYMGRAAPSSLWAGDWIVAGDSLTDISYTSAGFTWGFPLSMRPPVIAYNAGVQGNTIQNLISRLQAVIDAFPGVQNYLIRIGTNGTGGGTYASQFAVIYSMLSAAGKRAVMTAIPPKGLGTPGVDSGFIAANQALAALCAAHPTELVFMQDSSALGDANYNAIPAYYVAAESSNPIHMSGAGVYTQGLAQQAIWSTVLPAIDPRIADANDIYPANALSNQWVQNPFMSGTSGTKGSGVTGTLPTGWSAQGYTTMSVACSIVAANAGEADQTPWLRITPNSSNAGNMSIRTMLQHPALAANVSAVKRFDLVAEIRTNSLDSSKVSAVLALDLANSYKGVGSALPLAEAGIISKRAVLRATLPRDQGISSTFVTPEAFSANTLAVGLWVTFKAFTGSIGSIDIRCVSVRGKAT